MEVKIKRLLASVIDFIIICFLSSFTILIITLGTLETNAITITIYLVVFFLLSMFKDCAFKNASVGKRLMGICIVTEDETPVKVRDILKRNLPLLIYPVELLLLWSYDERLGDRWANTFVVEVEENQNTKNN